ncbi:hypothetical protein LX64_03482 [Chitinophaga skermanii]|uniref:DUF3313 domain-containing protein n=1 Tax=Chitinophaga skermanii TaxID=331697 RepID=A0A327QFB3_9BACT|nr:hypothetical protein [Chitinophaga skermanii]RAJ02464.1 hypothetical protein LX64_03482 [Chitinophaga skermanii]
MKSLFVALATSAMLFTTAHVSAQKLSLTSGEFSALKDVKDVNVELVYNDPPVGKFKHESEYLDKKKAEYNKKDDGRGDRWVRAWEEDKQTRFPRKFEDLLAKYWDDVKVSADNPKAKYTMILETTFMEPGFNVYVTRKNARINGKIKIVETADKSKVLVEIDMEDALGRTWGGDDYDTGARLSECYADAGKAVGQWLTKKVK